MGRKPKMAAAFFMCVAQAHALHQLHPQAHAGNTGGASRTMLPVRKALAVKEVNVHSGHLWEQRSRFLSAARGARSTSSTGVAFTVGDLLDFSSPSPVQNVRPGDQEQAGQPGQAAGTGRPGRSGQPGQRGLLSKPPWKADTSFSPLSPSGLSDPSGLSAEHSAWAQSGAGATIGAPGDDSDGALSSDYGFLPFHGALHGAMDALRRARDIQGTMQDAAQGAEVRKDVALMPIAMSEGTGLPKKAANLSKVPTLSHIMTVVMR